ncbi:GFA family protein [Neptuniibacter sp.]|uniref:GFA family protein n=1 Tax=Neptuniibacter sp. TaxID=1962643 RepID=UPI002637FD7C|nr:GFA family protein [Neptuniibacter sp.]MCP4595585.1 aldehyde-activating protein [Neptuniibacter sp.]
MPENHKVHCDCNAVEVSMSGSPKVHAFCHCEDCRELLQVPYHSVLAWEADQVSVTKGADQVIEFQHPTKRMTRVFCKHCGEVVYNTNAMGWKLISQLMYRKCNDDKLPEDLQSNAHFFYDRRIVDVDDALPKR